MSGMATRLARWGLIAATTAATVTALIVLPATADAATAIPNPYSPRIGHAYRHGAVPTRAVSARMRHWNATHPQLAVVSAANLRYGGGVHGIGVSTGAPRVYLVFYGSQWGTAGTNAAGDTTLSADTGGIAPRLQQLFRGVGTGGELWSGVMTQFCEGVAALSQSCPAASTHVGYPTGGALAGVWADTAAASPASATGHQLALVAVAAANHFGNLTAAANRNAQYVIVSPHGSTPDGFNTAAGNFCAWHDWNGDTTLTGGAVNSGGIGDLAFTNLPYVTDAGAGCGVGFVNAGAAGALDGVTIVEGHEYAETITDQNPAGGWTDSTGEENADKCAWVSTGTGRSTNVAFSTGTFAMQTTWSNDIAGCQLTHPIVTNNGNTVTVTNPGNRTGTVGTATSLQIAASDSGGLAVTYSASGLPTGLSIAPSTGLISGTPTAAGSFTTTVAASDSTGATGSTGFSWTIAGAGGGCTGAGQKLGNPGFETGTATPWTASTGVIDSSASQPARTGTWKAWLNGYGTTHIDTLTQTVTLPTGCTSYTFSFWAHIDTAETTTTTAFDRLTVQAGSSTLVTLSNLSKNTGYALRSFSLATFAGQTVTLKFTGTEDASLQTSFVIDDTAVTVA
jgi:hypothetical protein